MWKAYQRTFMTSLPCRIQFLRYLKEFLQLTYKVSGKEEELKPADDEGEVSGQKLNRLLVTLSCVGVGYANINRGIM